MDQSSTLYTKRSPEKASLPSKGERYVTFRSIVAYDAEWSEGENTEYLAFSQALKLLPETPSALYFAFPWARLIDLLQSNHPDGDRLLGVLTEAKGRLGSGLNIVTVCQHKNLLKYQALFATTGITHLFWPHASSDLSHLPDYNHVRLWPFPAAPALLPEPLIHPAQRSRLLCWTDTDALTQEHDSILRQLSTDPRDSVVMIPQSDISAPFLEHRGQGGIFSLIEPWQILRNSQFSLCAEPGSSWLWTSLACETIPVFFEKTPCLPGNRALWETAAICHSASVETFLELPGRLAQMAGNETLLELKRRALRQLRLLYGAECFVYDIIKLFIFLAGSAVECLVKRPGLSYGRLNGLAAQILQEGDSGFPTCANIFTLGCSSRVLSDPATFLEHYREDDRFRLACLKAFASCSESQRKVLRQALTLKGVVLQSGNAVVPNGETTLC